MDAVVKEYFRLRARGARPWAAWFSACVQAQSGELK